MQMPQIGLHEEGTYHDQSCDAIPMLTIEKYCECYAGNVNCSPSCRCMGCKNVSTGEMMQGVPFEMPVPIHPHPPPRMQRRPGEPWQAAQNLTFLKHGSPEKKEENGIGPNNSMPSLASSEATSPGDKKPAEENFNSLSMLAAYAMTEFGQGSASTKKKTDEPDTKRQKTDVTA